jgi:membrane protease subunit HflK
MSLNDPRWGRSSDEDEQRRNDGREDGDAQQDGGDDRRGEQNAQDRGGRGGDGRGPRRDGDEDIDRLWKEFSDMLQGMLGGGRRPNRQEELRRKLKSRDDFSGEDSDDDNGNDRWEPPRGGDRSGSDSGSGSGGGMSGGIFGGTWPRAPKPSARSRRIGLWTVLAAAVLVWGASGFYIVPEGQSGVVTTFGRYTETTSPGFRWHLPLPIQDADIVDVSSVRTAEIGFPGRSDRLREALMLTDDENIVDVQFTVQYRIKPGLGARDYLFRCRKPDLTVTQAAESAMREVVGRKLMDSVLFESKAEIAEDVKKSMQTMLDRYQSGIEVMSVAIQNAQPPQQVQAAFNDAVKAGQDRERSINLGEAYRNAIIPKAEGTAARLKEEAAGYQARIVETARGDADRFSALYEEYKKAPEVTRDRLYIDTIRSVLTNVSKIYVDAKEGNNMLYLPLEKIVSTTKSTAAAEAAREADAVRQQPSAPVQGAAAAASSSSADSTQAAQPAAAASGTDSTMSEVQKLLLGH